jgi:hypothetical protein
MQCTNAYAIICIELHENAWVWHLAYVGPENKVYNCKIFQELVIF